MKIKFLGAAGTVTGSCYRLSDGESSLLIDFGMFQGKPENEGWNMKDPEMDISQLTGVVITHAHLDHCGRLPLLSKGGFSGPIFMTEPTKALVEIVLYDAAKISKEEAKSVIYTEEDVEKVMKQITTVSYEDRWDVGGFGVDMLDSGHILGSASPLITEKKSGKKVVFSGDLGNTPEPLIAPTEWAGEADVAVMESTYGDRVHSPGDEVEELVKIIKKAEETGGTVMIPSFSLQRAQELLYIFDQLKKKGKMKEETPVFLDSPMAIKATAIFKEYPQLYSKALKEQVKTDDPFDFPSLVLCDVIEKSKQIKNTEGAKVIVAGSGMMSGGRIIHHAINFLGDPKTQLVFVGYQAEGTLGREIKDGAASVTIWGNKVPVAAEIINIETMSAHADQGQLLNWAKKIQGLKQIFLVHGEELPRLVLKEKIRQDLEGVKVELPSINSEIDLRT